MQKRGQITIFVIVGLIILAISIFIVLLNTKSDDVVVSENLGDFTSIQSFVQGCVEKVSQQGITRITRQGGYYHPPEESSIVFFNDMLPYFYEEKQYKIITQTESENELSDYLIENLPKCTAEFTNFEQQGYLIMERTPQVEVIMNQKIIIDVNYPLVITKADQQTKLEKFTTTIDLDMQKFLQATKALVDLQVKHNGYICLTCLQEINKQYNVVIDVLPIYDPTYFNNDIIWYRLTDPQNEFIGKDELIFEFITEYFQQNITIVSLEIEDIPDLTVSVGEEINFMAKVSHKAVFQSKTDLFKISNTGKIKFTAQAEYFGENLIYISATDASGNKDQEIFTIIIK